MPAARQAAGGRSPALGWGPALIACQMVIVAGKTVAGLADPISAGPTPQVIVSADRAADPVLQAKIETVLRDDPYIFSDHVTVRAENGVVRVEGIVYNVQDMRRILYLARRIAGKRRVVNLLELVVEDDEGTG